ncbi:hypothetical protein TWF730_001470 [Orbilia blumenaviensis]|uniref:Uncharacterized protein n=1 Tax=Orbilia blumenaviensis TaxID=1796055 RepID=A0AAV9UKW5_9PEZI
MILLRKEDLKRTKACFWSSREMALSRLREEPELESLLSSCSGFDWYYEVNLKSLDKWPQLSEEERYRKLAIKYLRLGHDGRLPYIERATQSSQFIYRSAPLPARRCAKEHGLMVLPRVPASVYTNRERWACQYNSNYDANVLLFRTWFGDEEYSISRSDELYEKLILNWKEAWQYDERFFVNQGYCFTDVSYADESEAPVRSDANSLEEWLLSRLPDFLSSSGSFENDLVGLSSDWDDEVEEQTCLAIIDKETVINGWLLVSTVNHKGNVLGRWRIPVGSLAPHVFLLGIGIPEQFAESLYYRGFVCLDGRIDGDQSFRGAVFPVLNPPGLWWFTPNARGFAFQRPSEKAPPW